MSIPLRRHPDDSHPALQGDAMFLARKNAISNALSPYLSGDSLAHAMHIWEMKYANQPTFAMQRFISEFLDGNLAGQRSRILQALFLALHNIGGAPAEETTVTPPVDATVYSNLSALRVFSSLVEQVLALTPRDQETRIRLATLNQLPRLKVDEPTRRDLYAWLSQRYPLPAQFRMAQPAMRQFVNLVYIALCEQLGPIKADAVLHDSVQRVENQSREDFPVRDLL